MGEPSLSQRITAKRDDVVALTQALIQVPTLNPPGEHYRPGCEVLGERLRARGFEVVYIRAEGAPGDSPKHPRWNVVARKEGGRPGPTVHFNGHIDVVTVGEGWSVDPFAGTVKDGRVYGRGACDMKGGLAAAVIAVEALLETVPDLPGALEISATADEESGGYGGVAYLAERGYFSRPRVDHVIIPEPLNPDRVCIGHRGVWWAEIETHGRIAHGAMPFLGDSAIRHMGAVLEAFEKRLYPALARRRTAMPVVPEGAQASTMNINSIHGGMAEPTHDEAATAALPSACVADSCRAVIDRRYLIEESLEDVRQEVVDLLDQIRRDRPDFRYDLRDLWSVDPTLTDADAPVVKAVSAEIERIMHTSATLVASPGTYDQKHIARIGQLKESIAYGPGILDLAHQPDEWIGIEDMVRSAQVMAGAALSLLTGGRA